MGTARSIANVHRALIRPVLCGWLAVAASACAAVEGGSSVDALRPSTPQRESRDVLLVAAGDDLRDERAQSEPDLAGVASVAVPIGGTGFSRGRSTAVIKAPIERVRATVLAFERYPDFMPHYKKCRVLGRTPSGGWDVYMEVSALHGAVSMWARIEMQRAVAADGAETYSSRFVSGNVQDLQATWRLEKVDDQSTRLSLDVFLRPKLPLPKSLLNAENLEGSARAIAAIRARVENGRTAVADAP